MRRRSLWLLWAGLGIVAILAIAAFLGLDVRGMIEARTVAQQARAAVLANQTVLARDRLDRWSTLDPRGGEPDYYRAMLDVKTEQPVTALDAIRRSLARGYPEKPLLVLRAILLARANKYAEAEPVLAAAFEDGTEPRVEVAEGLARIYLKNFRLDETRRVLQAWMKFAPDDARPYLLRNQVDERTNADVSALVRNYREVLRRDPNRLDARFGLAEKLHDSSLIDESEIEYATLLERDPRHLRGLIGAGQIALLKGDLQAAVRHLEGALALDPREEVALRELGLIDLKAGRIAQALTRLKLAVEVDPFDSEAHYIYSRTLMAAGDSARAAEEAATTERLKKEQRRITDMRQQLAEHPNDTDLRCEFARFLIEHGHEKEGLEWTALNLRQKPGDPKTSRLLVEYYTRQKDFGLANFYRLDAGATSAGP